MEIRRPLPYGQKDGEYSYSLLLICYCKMDKSIVHFHPFLNHGRTYNPDSGQSGLWTVRRALTSVMHSLWASFSCLKSSCLDSKSGLAADPGGAFGLERFIFLTFDIKNSYSHSRTGLYCLFYYSHFRFYWKHTVSSNMWNYSKSIIIIKVLLKGVLHLQY